MQRKRYYFNEGMGGIVVARTLKQAIKIIANKTGMNNKERAELRKEIKNDIKFDPECNNSETDWMMDWESTNDKTGFRGWAEQV